MKLIATFLMLMSLSIPAYASGTDADLAEIKAHEKAMQEKNANDKVQEENRKRQEAAFIAKQNAQTASAMRPQLGKAAEGKSDEEVIRMYEAKVAQDEKKTPPNEDAIRAQGDATTKKMTGKSMQDMQNMSDEDMDKMEAEMLKKYNK